MTSKNDFFLNEKGYAKIYLIFCNVKLFISFKKKIWSIQILKLKNFIHIKSLKIKKISIVGIKMYNLTKLKILVIGPEASGKTTVVNYLAQKSNVL